MQRIYFITFYLCFVTLSMPLAYSTAEREYYSHCPIDFLYPAAMLAYQEDTDLSAPFVDMHGWILRPKHALKEIKKRLRRSPTMYLWTVKGYLRTHFDNHDFQYPPQAFTPIIMRFLVRNDYENNKKNILSRVRNNIERGFITEWLEDEMRFYHLYTSKIFLKEHINSLKPLNGYIYIYKNNFLKQKLLSWLIKEHEWPVYTNKEIHALEHKRYIRKSKEKAYKLIAAGTLKGGKIFFYHLVCLHLLNKQRLDGKLSYSTIVAHSDHTACKNLFRFSMMRCCSTLYWQYIDEFLIDTTGNLVLDIFCAPLLLAFTTRGLLGIYCCWFIYIVYLKS